MDSDQITYEIKIPQERVAVLIGKDGETKKLIEEKTGSTLQISKEGDVVISGEGSVLLYTVREIVQAIGRGFNPKIALTLLDEKNAMEMIDLKDVAGKNKNTMERLKGRVIGSAGKSREEIERLTDTHISVYGKTIGIIGELETAFLAREAVAMLLKGSMHKTVYQFLEKKKKERMFG